MKLWSGSGGYFDDISGERISEDIIRIQIIKQYYHRGFPPIILRTTVPPRYFNQTFVNYVYFQAVEETIDSVSMFENVHAENLIGRICKELI